jgi:hypothetical protein
MPHKLHVPVGTPHVRRICLMVVFLLGAQVSSLVTNVSAQGQINQSGNLTQVIQPEIRLQEQGTDAILEIRLSGGTNAKVWADNSCGISKDNGETITASGM